MKFGCRFLLGRELTSLNRTSRFELDQYDPQINDTQNRPAAPELPIEDSRKPAVHSNPGHPAPPDTETDSPAGEGDPIVNAGTTHPTDAGLKALAINLDPLRYGSFAEIGAGLEVVRAFFRVGGAAGTVAKSMSAYDMSVSDAIYGKASRYVSRERLEAMLEHELALNRKRLADARGEDTAFFAFADTVSAQSFKGNPDCHAWMGVRFQAKPGADESQITLHVRLLDRENVQQQEAIGIVGVNLIYGAFSLADDRERLLRSLLDGLTTRRIEIDMIEFSGAAFAEVDNRIMSLKLVELGLTNAAMFSADGTVLQASDALYKKPVLIQRGRFRPPTLVHSDMHNRALEQFRQQTGLAVDDILSVAEMTMSNLMTESCGSTVLHDFLEQVDTLALVGLPCVITRYPEFYRVADYLARHTREPIGMVMGANILGEVFNESYYEDLPGGLLEGMGRLFKRQVRIFVHPWLDQVTGELNTAENLELPDAVATLYQYLLTQGKISAIEGYNPEYLSIHSDDVRTAIRANGEWQHLVAPRVAELIRRRRFFGSPAPKSP